MFKFVFTFCLTLISASLIAQTTLSGMISDENGNALPGANCYLEGTYDGATSDTTGRFELETMETGTQTLLVSFIGYDTWTQEVNLDSTVLEIAVQLGEAFNELKAVSITAGSFEASDSKKAVILSSLDMVTTAGASGDAYGALQTLPGTSTNGESGRLFVRGGSSDESKTFINGTLVHQPFGPSAPQTAVRGRFNPFMFKGTVFSTGGFSAEYGQALSSVLLLKTNDSPIEDQLNISILSVGGDLAGTKKWNSGALTVSANYSNLGPYLALVPQNIDWEKAPTSYGSALSLWQETGKSGVFKLYAAWDESALSLNQTGMFPDTAQQRIDLTNKNLFVNASWRDLIGEKWVLETGASMTFNKEVVDQNQNGIDQGFQGTHLKSVLTHQLTQKLKLRGGLEYYGDDHADTYRNESNTLALDLKDHRITGFLESDLYASSKAVARIGGRMEYNPVSGKMTAAPRASLAYKTGSKSQVSFAYGWFYQPAEVGDRFFAPDLDPARADHYILNFQHIKNKRSFRSEVYFKDYRNLTKYSSPSQWPLQSYNTDGHGYAYGLDLFFRDQKTIKNGDYWVSYSFLETKRDFQDYPELATPTFSSRHNLSVVYKHWISDLRSMLGVTFSYGSPRVYNDLNDQEFNAAKSPAFRSLDMNWSFLYRQNIIFHAAVSNVIGFQNEFGRQFASQPDATGSYASEAILPPAPRFFVLGCFITLSRKADLNQLDKIN